MMTFKQVLDKYPPRYASEVSESYGWYFLLSDGKIVGSEKGVTEGITHRKILGIEDDDKEVLGHYEIEKKFCEANQALRIGITDDYLNVEIFDVMPNEAQWSAIGTLYKKAGKSKMFWDVWLGDRYPSNHPWINGEGTLPKFRRDFDRAQAGRAKEGILS